jgi:nucleoside 2-deoxyribosyltransferase
LFLEKETEFAGEYLERASDWISHGWCINQEELIEILSFLTEVKRIRQNQSLSNSTLKIEANGWEHLEKIKKINAQSPQCFVAMWFSDDLKKIYEEVISVGIIEAGYTPYRVDRREHNEKIDDEIIAQIKQSKFLLADFTGNRGGVYYEAGFAKGLNIEVIWSCRDDHLEDLHFDIRQYNCIVWSENDLEEFKRRIKSRIGATIGFR